MAEQRMSDEQIESWIAQQKKQYRDGKLTDSQIERLEGIPGWSWDETPSNRTEDRHA